MCSTYWEFLKSQFSSPYLISIVVIAISYGINWVVMTVFTKLQIRVNVLTFILILTHPCYFQPLVCTLLAHLSKICLFIAFCHTQRSYFWVCRLIQDHSVNSWIGDVILFLIFYFVSFFTVLWLTVCLRQYLRFFWSHLTHVQYNFSVHSL